MILMIILAVLCLVALRKESVDRNLLLAVGVNLAALVALRKESVDRNLNTLGGFGVGNWSLSARRAWIEILAYPDMIICTKSLSARRAWIEILLVYLALIRYLSRSPQGERG